MGITTPTYVSRDEVKHALDVAASAYADWQVDRAIVSATDAVDGLLHRRFTPWSGTRYFDWPDSQSPTPWRLWLDDNELISVSALTSGGATIAAADYFLRRSDRRDEPPYTHIEIDLAGPAAFGGGPTGQRDIAVTGVFGHSADEETVGELAGTLASSLTATASITWTTARVGVGDLLRIDTERMLVSERSMVDSTQNLGTPLTASAANVTVAVTDGTAFGRGTVLLLDSERMLVQDVAGNNLTVKRAYDGTVLATHTGSDIYTLSGVELVRARAGTTLAAHTAAAVIYRHVVPGLVRDLALAYALNQLLQEQAGYARVAGSGDMQRELTGRGVSSIEDDCRTRFGRMARTRAV